MTRQKKLSGERGTTTVEFAIATTVFFLLVFGGIQFSRAVWQYNVVANASKAAARWAAVRGSSNGQTAATSDQVHDYILTQMYGYAELDTVTWNPTTKAQGSVINVMVRSSFTPSIPLFSNYTLTLRSVSQNIVVR
jgi:Flp pilus assembly protein TadG